MIAKYYIYAVTREEERFSETFLTFLEADLTKKKPQNQLLIISLVYIAVCLLGFLFPFMFIFLFFCHTMYIFICKCRQICSLSGGE